MQLTRSRKLVGGLMLAGALTLTGVGFAQQTTTPGQDGQGRMGRHHGGEDGERGGREGRFGGPFSRLNLTDAQKQQMQQIAERYRATFRAERRGERGEHKGFDPLAGGTFDEAAVRAAAQARANAEVESEVAHAKMMYEMYNVLTPEQKQQLATERQQREQQREQWRARRNAAPQTQEQ